MWEAPGMTLSVDDYVPLIGVAAERLAAEATDAGLDAPVPTCPEWTVAELVGHQGEVHRWAASVVSGALDTTELTPQAYAATLPPVDAATLLDWFAAGAAGLQAALSAAPEDLRTAVFLKDAPAPRVFWARRQTHETTIHAADALSARLGRLPTAAEVGVDIAVALDGIDELLTGFITRRSSRLRLDVPGSAELGSGAEPGGAAAAGGVADGPGSGASVLVAPTDADAAWSITLSADPPVTARGADPDREPDVVLTGSAAALYLGLWNRGDEIAATGADELLGLWRERVRISWA
jgi:uncharacterized protein (TIGR03083 family)